MTHAEALEKAAALGSMVADGLLNIGQALEIIREETEPIDQS